MTDRDESAARQAKIAPLRPRQYLLVLLGLAFLWPALLNGDAFQMKDSISYVRAADTAVVKLVGFHNPNFSENVHVDTAAAAQHAGNAPPAPAPVIAPLVIYGRSVYFGLFLYLGTLIGSLWLPIVVQALVAGAVVVAVVRHFVEPADERRFVLACLASFAFLALTSLPYFVSFLMPDLLVGLALVCATLMLTGERERMGWRLAFLAIGCFAALAHSSAVALLFVLGLGGLLAAWHRRSRSLLLTSLLLIGTAGMGVAGEAAFAVASRVATGSSPLRPPFLTARLVEDGPARRYLAEHCDDAPFVMCRYPIKGRMTAEIFLWNEDPAVGRFKALPPADRIAVSREQVPFVLAVLKTYPADTIGALAGSLLAQLGQFQLTEFDPQYSASSEMLAPHHPMPVEEGVGRQLLKAANAAIPVVMGLATLAALILVPFVLRRGGRGRAIVCVVTAAIFINDVICAWLSGPFARYQTRVIWALPFVVMLWLLFRERERLRPA
jgi:hypothetical protein